MAAHAGFKGQLGLRSSALAPTSSKLTTQYLVLDHMNNHYKKIVNAKPAIDNGRPKSINKSQKIRDRKTRNYVEKTGSRPHSSMNVRPSHDYYDDQNLYGEDLDGYDVEDEDDQLVLDIMRTTLRANSHPHGGSADATYGSESDAYHKHHLEPQHRHAVGRHYQQRPASARSLRSAGSATSRTALLKGPPKAGTYDGDLLDKRSQVFTEPEKPFTPRILKSTRSSKLSQNKYYTPPPQKRKENDTARENHANEGVNAENKTKPKPKPRHTSPHARPDSTMSENTLMYETLHTRDFSKFDTNHEQKVPPLDISMDKDHMNWIKEQASKAQIRAKSATLKSTMSQIHEDDYLDSTGGLGETGDMTLGKTNRNFGTKTMRNQTMMGQDSMYQGKSPRLTQAEEELKYVEFTKEVTDDVLNRGIFTNRVLKQVFRTHLQKNRGILNESKMRAVLDKIRLDLDIPDTDNYNDLEYTGDHSFDNATTMSGTFQSASLYNTGMSKFGNRTLDDTIDSQNTFGLTSNAGDLYSTINTNMGTLTDTQALKSYQLNISKKMALDGEHVDDEHLEGSGKFEVTMKTDDTQSNVSAASMTKAGKERAGPQASRPRQVLVKSSISDKEAALDGDGDASEGEIVEGSTLVRRSSTQAGSRDHMSDVGSVKGSVKGSIKGSVVGSVKGSVKSLPSHHSERGALLDDEEGENNTIYASTGGNDDEDGAYGEDEFEESEDEKTQGATHRTSDDDF